MVIYKTNVKVKNNGIDSGSRHYRKKLFSFFTDLLIYVSILFI